MLFLCVIVDSAFLAVGAEKGQHEILEDQVFFVLWQRL